MSNLTINTSVIRKEPFLIGWEGESNVTEIEFDFSEWATEYGSGGVLELKVNGPADEQARDVSLSVSGDRASWIVTDTDTEKAGRGSAQLSYIINGKVKKSAIYSFTVLESLQTPPA